MSPNIASNWTGTIDGEIHALKVLYGIVSVEKVTPSSRLLIAIQLSDPIVTSFLPSPGVIGCQIQAW